MQTDVEFNWTYSHSIGEVFAFELDFTVLGVVYDSGSVFITDIILADGGYEREEDGKYVKKVGNRTYLSNADTGFDKAFANQIRNSLDQDDAFIERACEISGLDFAA